MQSFPVGTNAVVEVPFLDSDGNPVTPTALAYVVKDGQGTTLVDTTAISVLSGTSTDIAIPGGLLAAPGGYSVELFITIAGGEVYIQEEVFAVKPLVQLQFLTNTFQTRANALYVSGSIPNLISWMGATKDAQTAALIEAFRRITLLNFFIPWPEVLDLQNRIAPRYQSHLTPRMWPLMTPDIWTIYPDYFKDALNRAQVIQANQLLTADPMADRRRGGLFSEKIGESSVMFKSGVRPLDDIVSRDAMTALSQFLNTRITTTRS
jgi:hypothetical protein